MRTAKSLLFKMGFISVLLLLFLFNCANVSRADAGELSQEADLRLRDSISLYISSSKAYVGNKVIKIDPNDSDVVPVIRNGRTLLPVRFVVENFGAKVSWDKSTSTIGINFGDKTAKLKVGNSKMTVDGTEFILDTKAEIINSRTYIPLRGLVENLLGKKVFYYKGLIIISDKEKIFDESSEAELLNEISDLTAAPLFMVRKNGKIGYIDRYGIVVIEPQYEYGGTFYEGLAPVKINGKYGYINRFGEMVINNTFEDSRFFSEGLAAVKVDRSAGWGYLNKKGELVIKTDYEEVYGFNYGRAVFCEGGKCGCIDKDGNIAIKPIYDTVGNFHEGVAYVRLKGKYGYVDTNGRVIIEPKYEYANNFSEGLAAVCVNNKYGYIDKTGKFIIKPEFQYASDFFEGLACVELNDKWGYIDKTGKFVIKPTFEVLDKMSAHHARFKEGLAVVMTRKGLDYQFSFIDKTGKVIIQPNDNHVFEFEDGLATVMSGDKIGYINISGKYIWKLQD